MVKSEYGHFLSKDEGEIGDIAEDHFASLCSSAGVTSTQSRRDRFGWDYYLEYKLNRPAPVILDTEEQYFSCHVQVKGFTGTFDDYSGSDISLSNIQYMINNDKPQFFAFVSVDSELKDTYLVHLDHSLIRYGLERIRKTQAKSGSNIKLNKSCITINPHTRGAIKVNASDLKSLLEKVVGTNISNYSSEKVRFRREAGYENGKLEISIIANPKDLIDIELGLKPSLKVDVSAVSDIRFDFPISLDKKIESVELFSATNTHSPNSEKDQNVEVELIRKSNEESLLFKGRLKVSILSLEFKKFVVDSEFFIFVIEDNAIRVNFKYEKIISAPQKLSFLKRMYKSVNIVLDGEGTEIKIHTDESSYSYSLKAEIDTNLESILTGEDFLIDLNWLISFLNIGYDEKIVFKNYLSHRSDLTSLIYFLQHHEKVSYKLTIPEQFELKDKACVISPIEINTSLGRFICIHKFVGNITARNDDSFYFSDASSRLIVFGKRRKNSHHDLRKRLISMIKTERQSCEAFIHMDAISKELSDLIGIIEC
ncbi:hypothetical protein [Pseudoalteromonas shioyasakiensis]|uniref:hypothetical protein n=1 Tax=Pseudoalteromonas shioyasakiensis TaxID=1190813 RepID=UPI002551CC7E|nr:hypothetical protein [Pseudoalteromonas shioyasakiensis]MDK9681830.1 hypothetical protein [Pseudoalteromonas shioyasakiensis]